MVAAGVDVQFNAKFAHVERIIDARAWLSTSRPTKTQRTCKENLDYAFKRAKTSDAKYGSQKCTQSREKSCSILRILKPG